MKLLKSAIGKIVEVDPNNDESIERMLQDIRICVKNSSSTYFRKTFPKLYA